MTTTKTIIYTDSPSLYAEKVSDDDYAITCCVDGDGNVRVFDPVAGYFVRNHSLDASLVQQALRQAAR